MGDNELQIMLKSAIFRMEEELTALYMVPDETYTPTEAAREIATQNVEHVKELVAQYLCPVINALNDETAKTREKAKNMAIMVSENNEVEIVERKRSPWAIFLAETVKTIPGWSTATAKLTFASAEYKKLSIAQKEQIVHDYYQNRNMPVPTGGGTKTKNRVPRLCGLDAFRKAWYEERKKVDPNCRGLDARCSEDWKALSPEEKAEWKEVRRQQIADLLRA
jgi:hypothetical protein